jgi:hypothetical protein
MPAHIETYSLVIARQVIMNSYSRKTVCLTRMIEFRSSLFLERLNAQDYRFTLGLRVHLALNVRRIPSYQIYDRSLDSTENSQSLLNAVPVTALGRVAQMGSHTNYEALAVRDLGRTHDNYVSLEQFSKLRRF